MSIICKKDKGKYYPSANKWMWSYCIYLGSVEYNGHQYDLGVYCAKGDTQVSAAIVSGHRDGDYLSGSLDTPEYHNELYHETWLRYNIMKEITGEK